MLRGEGVEGKAVATANSFPARRGAWVNQELGDKGRVYESVIYAKGNLIPETTP